ncbi:MAG: hypothetical protein K2W95_02770 [Candidatus Obscuribacterales bacterium]|nr:hypothetical protein [Candidatus Obscuribacterales bacterium]
MDVNTAINTVVACALAFLAFSVTALFWQAVPLINQLLATVTSCKALLQTIEKEVAPTAEELRQLAHGVNQLRALTVDRVVDVGTKVEDATQSVGTVVTSAKRESKVWGHGLLAGVKAYFAGASKDEEPR